MSGARVLSHSIKLEVGIGNGERLTVGTTAPVIDPTCGRNGLGKWVGLPDWSIGGAEGQNFGLHSDIL